MQGPGRFVAQDAVGRKSRRAEDGNNTFGSIAPDLSRSVQVACPWDAVEPNDGVRNGSLEVGDPGHGSNPARTARLPMDHPRRAEIFALPRLGPQIVQGRCRPLTS